ncbi:hypothetical protein TNCV_2708631 [Trichonephila clavipes]|nr:hypothetical protein TNCV_2708631 [Trichonephila clavipes]
MVQNDQRVTLREISLEMGLSYGSVQHIVSDVWRYSKMVSSTWTVSCDYKCLVQASKCRPTGIVVSDADCGAIGTGTATAGSDVVQSGRPIFDEFFQHVWPYIGNNTANVVFQMVKRLWLIRIDQ